MNINIRHYTTKDYPMIREWWDAANEPSPTQNMLPIETTFIMEQEGIPSSCICLYLTNCNELAYLGNFISNPATKGLERHKANKELLKFVKEFSKACGFNNVLAYAKSEGLKKHYEKIGMRKTLTNLDSFVLEG